MSGDETITREELRAYFRYEEDMHPMNAQLRADNAFEHAEAHREPEPQPGEAWQAPCGTVYLRSRIGDWVDCSGTRRGDSSLEHPLRKLGPEDFSFEQGFSDGRDDAEAKGIPISDAMLATGPDAYGRGYRAGWKSMTPEGSLAQKPTYYQVRDAIEDGSPHGPVPGSSSAVADRIMKLLDGAG